jgi:tetratricopeptide (TPR) repeat protein
MRPELNAALTRYRNDKGAREALRAWRKQTLALSERREVARWLTEGALHRAAALWWFSACRQSNDDARDAYRLANALRMAGRDRAAEKLLKVLCARYPDWTEPAQSLAWLYRRRGQLERAAEVLEGWVAAAGFRIEALLSVSVFLQDVGLPARAETLLAQCPNEAGAQAERGAILVKLGRFEEAEGVLRAALEARPEEAGAWLRLAVARRWRNEADSPRALMEAGLQKPGLRDDTRAAIGFALAKVDDDLERYAEAWQVLETANALRSRSAHFDARAWQRNEVLTCRAFRANFIRRAAAHDGAGESSIFIVGMPRSGTTLLERRLGRHSTLTPAGELEVIEALGLEATGCHGYPAAVAGMTPAMLEDVARLWRGRLPPALRESRTIIDKNPLNFLHLGWIACLFPRASIIHCRRDPLDTALSLWFQNFAHKKNDYAYRKQDIAWMHAMYRRLMSHWEHVLPGRIYNIDYEAIVADPEPELRSLFDWLNLEWEPTMLADSSDKEDAIATASVWQARQPVYSRSVGRARHYEPWIAELREALHAAGVSPA